MLGLSFDVRIFALILEQCPLFQLRLIRAQVFFSTVSNYVAKSKKIPIHLFPLFQVFYTNSATSVLVTNPYRLKLDIFLYTPLTQLSAI